MGMALLLASLFFGGTFIVLYAALERDPTPSMSGYLPAAIFCLCASPVCFLLAVVAFVIEWLS